MGKRLPASPADQAQSAVMKRVVIGLPCLASRPEEDSFLRGLSDGWQRLVERSRVFRISPVEDTLTPEAAWLGLDPDLVQIPQGPLTLSALKTDPPERSVHFHLSLLSLDDAGRVQPVKHLPNADEERAILQQAERLNARGLTFVPGWRADHGLVWEDGSTELACPEPSDIYGEEMGPHLPVGEGEPMLRRLIDDSVNLLGELPFNHIRREEGLEPLNLLWPWGAGWRQERRMLPLERGEMLRVGSTSMRMAGLCRLFGYAHSDWREFGPEVRVKWSEALSLLKQKEPTLLLMHPIEAMQRAHRLEEAERFLEELFERVIDPLLDEEDLRLTLLAPGWPDQPSRCSAIGLGLSCDSRRTEANQTPFDERILDDPKVRLLPLHEAVHIAFQWG